MQRAFDKQLEGARQAEATAARALAEQVSNKNPVALWLDSIIGTPVAKASVEGAAGRVSMVPAAVTSGSGVGAEGGGGRSYFESSVAAYALGLGLCFVVNFVSKSGQPGKTFLIFLLLRSVL